MTARAPSRSGRQGLSRRQAMTLLAGVSGIWLMPTPTHGARRSPSCPLLRGRRISWLVGWSAGGGYDIYSRLLEVQLEQRLGVEIVIENVPGASGLVAARRISAAAPDGLVLGIVYGAGLLLAPYSNPSFAPDLERDFTVLARIADQEQVLVASPALGVGSLEEFAARGRKQTLVLGSTGPTTMSVLLQSALARMLGIRIELVLGFPGTQELMAAVLRGDVDGTITSEDTANVHGGVPLLMLAPVPAAGATSRSDLRGLHGPDGVIATHPELFPSVDDARADAAALSSLLRVGRLIAAPPGLAAELHDCLEEAILASLADEEFRLAAKRAGRLVNPAPAAEVLAYVAEARTALRRFISLIGTTVGPQSR